MLSHDKLHAPPLPNSHVYGNTHARQASTSSITEPNLTPPLSPIYRDIFLNHLRALQQQGSQSFDPEALLDNALRPLGVVSDGNVSGTLPLQVTASLPLHSTADVTPTQSPLKSAPAASGQSSFVVRGRRQTAPHLIATNTPSYPVPNSIQLSRHRHSHDGPLPLNRVSHLRKIERSFAPSSIPLPQTAYVGSIDCGEPLEADTACMSCGSCDEQDAPLSPITSPATSSAETAESGSDESGSESLHTASSELGVMSKSPSQMSGLSSAPSKSMVSSAYSMAVPSPQSSNRNSVDSDPKASRGVPIPMSTSSPSTPRQTRSGLVRISARKFEDADYENAADDEHDGSSQNTLRRGSKPINTMNRLSSLTSFSSIRDLRRSSKSDRAFDERPVPKIPPRQSSASSSEFDGSESPASWVQAQQVKRDNASLPRRRDSSTPKGKLHGVFKGFVFARETR